jgi:hypothetical protein
MKLINISNWLWQGRWLSQQCRRVRHASEATTATALRPLFARGRKRYSIMEREGQPGVNPLMLAAFYRQMVVNFGCYNSAALPKGPYKRNRKVNPPLYKEMSPGHLEHRQRHCLTTGMHQPMRNRLPTNKPSHKQPLGLYDAVSHVETSHKSHRQETPTPGL